MFTVFLLSVKCDDIINNKNRNEIDSYLVDLFTSHSRMRVWLSDYWYC